MPSAKVAIAEFPEYILRDCVLELFLRTNLMWFVPKALKAHIPRSELNPGLFGLLPQYDILNSVGLVKPALLP